MERSGGLWWFRGKKRSVELPRLTQIRVLEKWPGTSFLMEALLGDQPIAVSFLGRSQRNLYSPQIRKEQMVQIRSPIGLVW